MADDAEAGEPGPAPAPDPALNYPRGNRLGNRHPRPTVVIVLAVILVVGGAWAWQALRPDSWACTLTATSGPVAASADGAFDAWWNASGPPQARATATAPGDEVDAPIEGDFVKRDDQTWEWHFQENALVVVHIDDRFAVEGVNRCDRA